MPKQKVLYADSSFTDLVELENALSAIDVELVVSDCQTQSDVIAQGVDATVIITELILLDETVFKACPALQLVYTNNVGTDRINITDATRSGILACNNPDYNYREVAEHTIALLLSLVRKIPLSDGYVRTGGYDYNRLVPLRRFENSTVGLLGFGRIARAVAGKLQGFKVKVQFYDPFVQETHIGQAQNVSLETLLKTSDYLCLHAPLTDKTRHIINADSLAMMKSNAAVINAARGELLDTSALVEALTSGHLSGAALDVVAGHKTLGPDHPLCRLDNVILTPHSAWLSEDAFKQCKNDLTNEIVRFFKNEPLKAILNPDILGQPSN